MKRNLSLCLAMILSANVSFAGPENAVKITADEIEMAEDRTTLYLLGNVRVRTGEQKISMTNARITTDSDGKFVIEAEAIEEVRE